MPDLAGIIKVQIDCRQGKINDLTIASSRPVSVSRMFVGRTPEQALAMVPMLYAVCGTAQGLAMVRALEQARGIRVEPAVETVRDILLLLENTRELLFRLCRDWISETQHNLQPVQHWQQLCSEYQDRYRYVLQPGAVTECSISEFAEEIGAQLHGVLTPLLGIPVNGFKNWLEQAEPGLKPEVAADTLGELMQPLWLIQQQCEGLQISGPVSPLPDLQQTRSRLILEPLLDSLQAGEYAAQPRWLGHCCETGSFAAYSDELLYLKERGWQPMALRYAAMLLTLCQVPQQLMLFAQRQEKIATEIFVQSGNRAQYRSAKSVGYAVVNTARGQLLHRVTLEDNLIRQYTIIAPTEWNLHPRGVVWQTLKGLPVKDRQQASELCRMMILLADPCVAFELEFED